MSSEKKLQLDDDLYDENPFSRPSERMATIDDTILDEEFDDIHKWENMLG